jgi:hypothetical protein
MKKMLATIAAVIVSLTMAAQSPVVYYTPVNKTMEVGIGFNPVSRKCILSILEESKKNVNFSLDILNGNGESVGNTTNLLNNGRINIIPKTKKVNYYTCDYELTRDQINRIVEVAKNNDVVVINGVELDSNQLVSSLKQLNDKWFNPKDAKMRLMRPRQPRDFRG